MRTIAICTAVLMSCSSGGGGSGGGSATGGGMATGGGAAAGGGSASGCSASNGQPDTCAYGQTCSTSRTCQDVAAPTCSSFFHDSHYSWNAATSTGPIIYQVTDAIADDTGACASGKLAHSVHVYAYWGSSWPAASAQAPQPLSVDISGNEVPALFNPASGYTPTGHDVDFVVTECSLTASPIYVAYYFHDGSGFCATTNGGTYTP